MKVNDLPALTHRNKKIVAEELQLRANLGRSLGKGIRYGHQSIVINSFLHRLIS
jgi:hypothetical protein